VWPLRPLWATLCSRKADSAGDGYVCALAAPGEHGQLLRSPLRIAGAQQVAVAIGDGQGAAERAAEVGHKHVAAEGRIALAQRRCALRGAQECRETGSASAGREEPCQLTQSPAAQVGQ